MKEVFDIISVDILRSIVNNRRLKIKQLNAIISLLIKNGVAFELVFTPATYESEASATLEIVIRHGVAIIIEIDFDSGEMFL